MTIIAGFKGHDGIVLCADTQETIGISKRKISKLRVEPSINQSELGVAFCGAGDNGPFIDKTVDLAWKQAQSATSLDTACEEIERSIKKTYREFGRIYQSGACPEAELIYGVKMQGMSKLFHAYGPIINSAVYYSAGVGQYLADFLAFRMFKDYLDVRQLQIIAAYILFQAKEHVDGCGGDSEIAILRDRGLSGRVDASRIDKISEVISFTDTDLAQALLLCADFGMSNREFRKNIKNMTQMLGIARNSAIAEIRQNKTLPSLYGYGLKTDALGIAKPRKTSRRLASRK